ncbi:MAG: hypothetical protein Q9M97_08130 [Candidatus Gracilibacteria bacterium]|nr:hypothetical protein [Candidatus Gracilibacteria bacterium]
MIFPSNVELINIDATKYDYSDSNFIYMFAPLDLEATKSVINELRKTSEKKMIKIYDIGGGVFLLGDYSYGKGWLNSKCISKNSNKVHTSIEGYKICNSDEHSEGELEQRTK